MLLASLGRLRFPRLLLALAVSVAGCSDGSSTLTRAATPAPSPRASASATATPAASVVSITSTGNFDAATQTLSMTIGEPAAAITVNGIGTASVLFQMPIVISETNVGSPGCPAGAIALTDLELDVTSALPIYVAAYAPATCTFAIAYSNVGAPAGNLATFTINADAVSGPVSIGDSIVLEGSSTIETFDASNPASTSVLTPAAPGPFVRDATGATFVGNDGVIDKYAPGASGSAAPIASVNLGTVDLGGLAVDASGNLFALDESSDRVVEYSSDLSTSIATLSGSATRIGTVAAPGGAFFPPGYNSLAVDANDTLYVLTSNDIFAYGKLVPGTNDTAPVLTIAAGYDVPDEAQQIAVDANRNLFFNSGAYGSIYEYPPGSTTSLAEFRANGNFDTFAIVGNRLYAQEDSFENIDQTSNLVYFTIGSTAPPFPVLTHADAMEIEGFPAATSAAASVRPLPHVLRHALRL